MAITPISIGFKALDYTAYSIVGDLTSLVIAPSAGTNSVTQSEVVEVSAALPELGQPLKYSSNGVGGPGGGQYIEILVDDEPRSGRVTSNIPYQMEFLQSPAHPENGWGSHMVHFILSAGDGLCVKDPGYAVSKVIHVMSQTSPSLSADGPIIIYNLPRAVHYQDDVTLDFALVNVAIDQPDENGKRRISDYQVRVYIDDVSMGELDYYCAYRILGMPVGSYEIRLALVHRGGQELPATDPYAHTKPRAFTVK